MNPDEKLGKKMSCPVEVVMADQRLARIDALFVTHSGLHVLVSKKEKAKASNWTQGALMDDRREAKKIYVPNLKDLAAGFTEALTEYMCQYTCASLPKSCPNLFDGYYNFGVQLRCCDSCLGILFIGARKEPLMVIVSELLPGMSLKNYLNSIQPR